MAIRVHHRDDPANAIAAMIASDARLVVWPGVGAWNANMNYVDMQPGEANVPHDHPVSEDTIFVLDGEGTACDLTNGTERRFGAGSVVHVPPGIRHQMKADRGSRIESVGGPCPADRSMLARLGLLPDGDPDG